MDNTNEMNPDLEKEESSLEKNEESSLDETKELSQDEAEELSQDETEELFFDENEDTFLDKVWKALHNQTFLYIVRRILSSLFTALLISAVISILISFVPLLFYIVLESNNDTFLKYKKLLLFLKNSGTSLLLV